jgi:hypothetical protein
MGRQRPKVAIPGAMIDLLRRGPYSLAQPAQQAIEAHKYPPSALVQHEEATRARLHGDYLLWLETWVIPELERLLTPQERGHRKAKA